MSTRHRVGDTGRDGIGLAWSIQCNDLEDVREREQETVAEHMICRESGYVRAACLPPWGFRGLVSMDVFFFVASLLKWGLVVERGGIAGDWAWHGYGKMVLTSYPNIDRHFVETTEAMIPRTASIVKVEKKKKRKNFLVVFHAACWRHHCGTILPNEKFPRNNHCTASRARKFPNLHIESWECQWKKEKNARHLNGCGMITQFASAYQADMGQVGQAAGETWDGCAR